MIVEQWCDLERAPEKLQVDIELRRLRLNSISRKDQNRMDVKLEGKDVDVERPMYFGSVECMASLSRCVKRKRLDKEIIG